MRITLIALDAASQCRPPHSVIPPGSRIGSRATGISLAPMIASLCSIVHDALAARPEGRRPPAGNTCKYVLCTLPPPSYDDAT